LATPWQREVKGLCLNDSLFTVNTLEPLNLERSEATRQKAEKNKVTAPEGRGFKN
jgi:hypothetical protein